MSTSATNSGCGLITKAYEKTYALNMQSRNASEAREKLYRLLDETARAHEPVLITGPRTNAVLIGEEEWNSCIYQAGAERCKACGLVRSSAQGRSVAEQIVKVLRMWTHYEWYAKAFHQMRFTP